MELSQMLQFKAVVECGSVSKAAEKLFLSQPAVSKSLHRIEDELGIKLFQRSGNKLALQPAGQTVLAHVERVLAELEAMKSDLKDSNNGKRIIRIISPVSSIVRYYVPYFMKERPDIIASASVREQGELESLLLNDKADVVFTSIPFLNPAVCNMLFEEEVLMISVPKTHPLAAFDSVSVKDLDGNIFLTKPSLGLLQKRQDELIAREKVSLQIIHQEDYLIYREMTKASSLPYFTTSIAQHFYGTSDHDRKNINHFALLSSQPGRAAKMERNLRSFIDYLVDEGELKLSAQNGILYLSTSKEA